MRKSALSIRTPFSLSLSRIFWQWRLRLVGDFLGLRSRPQRPPMDLLQRSHKNSVSIAKIVAVLLGTATVAVVLARFAVPYLIASLSATLPPLWSSVRFFLVPPYLFITVHFIIVAIWKLSDQKLHKDSNDKPTDAVNPVDLNVTPSKTVSTGILVESDAVTPISGSKSAESCVTTDSDENAAVSSRFESNKGEGEDEDVEEGMDLEDTWQTIVMKKSATWERSNETAAVAAEVAEDQTIMRRSVTFKDTPAVAEVNDELNRRFEAFIKKNYDQIRSY